MTRTRSAIVLAWLASVRPAIAFAQTPPAGPEFQINSTTAYAEGLYGVDVAADATGNFVVVWDGYGDGLDVFAQRFDSGGTAVGGEFVVNTTTYSAQAYHHDGDADADDDHDGGHDDDHDDDAWRLR